jgi:hypothetical protein
MTIRPLLLAFGLAAAAGLSAAPSRPHPGPRPGLTALTIPTDGTGWTDWDNGWGAYGDGTTYGNWDWLEHGIPGAAHPWWRWRDPVPPARLD